MYVHPKNTKHLLSHSRAIMALDHSRLGLENKFLENKSGRIFLRSTGLLCKSLPTNLRVCKPTFYTFYTSHLKWNSILWGAVFIIQTSHRIQYFTFFQDKLHSFNVLDHRLRACAFREIKPFKQFSKSPIRPAGSHFWQVTLQHHKEFVVFIFYSMVFITMCNLKSSWCARHFEYSCKRCSWTTENKRQSD